jgi:predicted CXXCH cytochrome family protein
LRRLLKNSSFKNIKGKSLNRLWLLLLLVIVLVPLLSTAKKQVHDFEGKCSMCHLSLSDGKKIFVKEIDFLCNDCHGEQGLSHPSGIRPSISIPDKFPLDWTGRLTCATCHNVHGSSEYLLRAGKPGKMFCYMCHKGVMEKHGGADQPAHSGRTLSATGFEITNPKSPIDRLSRECLSCHDSIIGSAADVKTGSGIWNHGNGVSHPIGTDYMKAYRKGRLKHPSSINPAVRLFDGKVGCGSCHNMYSKEKNRLVMNNRGSALCMACHLI